MTYEGLKVWRFEGIRLYYTIRNQRIVLLLVGGDKSSQNKDIEKAKSILNTLED